MSRFDECVVQRSDADLGGTLAFCTGISARVKSTFTSLRLFVSSPHDGSKQRKGRRISHKARDSATYFLHTSRPTCKPRLYAPHSLPPSHTTTPTKIDEGLGLLEVSMSICSRPFQQKPPWGFQEDCLVLGRYTSTHKASGISQSRFGRSRRRTMANVNYQSRGSSQVESQPPTSPVSPSPGSPAVGL